MADRILSLRFADITEAIDNIRSVLDGTSLNGFEGDWQKRWLVERGLEIISEASRHLPEAVKAGHPEIPWVKVAALAMSCVTLMTGSRLTSCGNWHRRTCPRSMRSAEPNIARRSRASNNANAVD
jgi:uncharacterized protein with HEPN domain